MAQEQEMANINLLQEVRKLSRAMEVIAVCLVEAHLEAHRTTQRNQMRMMARATIEAYLEDYLTRLPQPESKK